MGLDATYHVQGCNICQRFAKKKIHSKPIVPIAVSEKFEMWGIDFMGPITSSSQGNNYIIVATEYFPRWLVACACPDNTASTAVSFLYNNIYLQFGPPRTLLSDQGSHFRNRLMKELTKKIGTNQRFTTAYNPQCNRLTERFNKTLIESLEKMTLFQPTLWEIKLPVALWHYHTKVHTLLRCSPFEVLFGTKPNNLHPYPIEVISSIDMPGTKTADNAYQIHQNRANWIADIQAQAKHNIPEFHVGDKVLKFKNSLAESHSKKFQTRWTGPYTIFLVASNYNYYLQDIDGRIDKHPTNGRFLKRYHH